MDAKIQIRIEPEKCTGCRICELVCSAGKHNAFNPKRSRVRVVKMERFFIDIPAVCQQCPKPVCVDACESGAVEKTTTGPMAIDAEKCIGCEECLRACPFDAVFMDPVDNKAIVCDLCQGKPRCVEWCPTKALTLQPDSSASGRRKMSSIDKEARKLLKRWKIPLTEWERYYQKGQG